MSGRVRITVSFLLVVLGSLTSAHAAPEWVQIEEDRGVTVWTRDEPDRSLPTFRGKGLVQGEIHHLMAIILDNRRAPEWVARCETSKQLKRYDARSTLVYSRASSPWPVSDRDTVVKVTTQTIEQGREYRLTMRSRSDHMATVDGVVRIEHSHIYFHLKRINKATTRVEYSLNVDPGGYLPKWIVRMSTRSMPIDTIRALEAQAKKTRGQYDSVIKVLKSKP